LLVPSAIESASPSEAPSKPGLFAITGNLMEDDKGEWSLVQWLQVLILCGEDMGSNPAGKLFTPQKLSIHIPNPSLPPSLRRCRGRVPSEILQTFP
jgi:hypothetical protein